MKKLFLALVLLSGCTSAADELTKEQLGDKWPFTVPVVTVGCDGIGTYVETPDGRQFALNGSAGGFRGPDGQKKYLNLDEIWLLDATNGPGGHKDLTAVIDAAQKQCAN